MSKKTPIHIAFISPSTKEGSTVADAMSDESGREMVKKAGGTPGVGFWKDGAEVSGLVTGDTPSSLLTRAAKLGKAWRQKAVIAFTEHEHGTDLHHIIRTPESDPLKIDKELTKRGVEFKTVLPHSYGSVVHVLDSGGQQEQELREWCKKNGSKILTTHGRVHFIGADDRDAAQHEFDRVIAGEGGAGGVTKLARKQPQSLPELYHVAAAAIENPHDPTGYKMLADYLDENHSHDPSAQHLAGWIRGENELDSDKLDSPITSSWGTGPNNLSVGVTQEGNSHWLFTMDGPKKWRTQRSGVRGHPKPNFSLTTPQAVHTIHVLGGMPGLADFVASSRLAHHSRNGTSDFEQTFDGADQTHHGYNGIRPRNVRLAAKKNPSRSWLKKKIALLISEGKTPKQAAGEAYGMVRSGWDKKHPLARGTDPEAQRIAQVYVEKTGGTYNPEPSTLSKDPALGQRVARLYSRLPHRPDDPKVKASYDALKKETLAQYQHLKDSGINVQPWSQPGQPYANSAAMREDVAKNKRLFYFPTGEEMDQSHPLAEKVGGTNQSYNDMFRAVHDFFGHAVHGHEFGPQGELRAWEEHARMFSPQARPALSMETHGQNSWVNFGPHAHLPAAQRPYAEQKANVLPEKLHPKKLARRTAFRQDSPTAAHQTSFTTNSEQRKKIALQILKEAGLSPSAVRTVLAHEPGKGVRSTVLTAIQKRMDPEMSKYIASWFGLLSREKALTVFHPHASGPDRLHILATHLAPDQLGEYLGGSGIPKYLVEENAGGSRAYVFSPGGSLDRHVARVVGGTNASHSQFSGTGFRLGSGEGSDADARADYRKTIARFESAASGTSNPAQSTGPTS